VEKLMRSFAGGVIAGLCLDPIAAGTLAASGVEIFFQNFSTGFVIARLLSIENS
jgi:hypothetical protein